MKDINYNNNKNPFQVHGLSVHTYILMFLKTVEVEVLFHYFLKRHFFKAFETKTRTIAIGTKAK